MSASFAALLLAAGRSTRMATDVPKPYLVLRGRTVLEWNAERLAQLTGHRGTIVALDAASHRDRWPEIAERARGVRLAIIGGATRQESARLAFAAAVEELGSDFDLVLVHDCARPFFSQAHTTEALAAAMQTGGAILGHYVRDTLKRVGGNGEILGTVPREDMFQAATPQVFRRAEFERMLRVAAETGIDTTDDASLAEAAGIRVRVVDSPSTNVKLTRPEDLTLLPSLERLLDGNDG